MAVREDELEAIINLVIAHRQRFDEIGKAATNLKDARIWRSLDGKIEVGRLTEEDKRILEGAITLYLNEATVVATAIRGLMTGEPAPP